MTKKYISSLIIIIFLYSCSLSPGMNLEQNYVWIDSSEIKENNSNNFRIPIVNIDDELIKNKEFQMKPYKIGIGDKLIVSVWGIPDIFPMTNGYSEHNYRVVNTDGTIFFPYVGSVKAAGKSQVELRNEITTLLSEYFNKPQLDLTIAEFESQKVYVLGEVLKPKILNITETPISLSDAIGLVDGLNSNTSEPREVFVIRQEENIQDSKIYQIDLSSPSSFIISSEFYLKEKDIVFVNAKGITRWNRVISQFFPFSTFLNSVNNLNNE